MDVWSYLKISYGFSNLEMVRSLANDNVSDMQGQEAEKILFFYPREVSMDQQKLMVGLSEGLLTFTK